MSKFTELLPKSWKFYLFNLFICTVFILAGTLYPAEYEIPSEFWDNDKLVHFLAFAIWTFLLGLFRFFKQQYTLWPILIWGLFFGMLIEVLQHLLPIHRSAEWLDFLADGLGSLAALILLALIRKHLTGKPAPATA